ncbi:unnamed protein product [Clavelina lepadiformis]|uniref:Uncharacterized protein n=1 Tax=Clavelina lepadiformis TaxID=159417 RepID=A0ABP0FM57_CLALP
MSVASGALTRRSVHPASPVLLTKSGPLGTRIRRPAPIKRIKLRQSASYPEGNFEGNQLLDGSISLSPLYPNLTIDLHVRIATVPPPEFPLASTSSGIVHHLSGPDTHALARPLRQADRIGRRVGKVADISRDPVRLARRPHTATELRQPGTENSPRPADSPLGTGARAPEGTRRGDLSSAGRRVVRSRAYSTRPKESYLARGLLTAVQPVAALARR